MDFPQPPPATKTVAPFDDASALSSIDSIHAEAAPLDPGRLAVLRGDLGEAVVGDGSTGEILTRCAEAIRKALDAETVDIWTLDDANQSLHLAARARSGAMIDDVVGNIKVGEGLIGQVAGSGQTRRFFSSTGVSNSPDFALELERQGIVVECGPLTADQRVVGVVAVYSIAVNPTDRWEHLASASPMIAMFLERRRRDAERQSREHSIRAALEGAGEAAWDLDIETGEFTPNHQWATLLGYRSDDFESIARFAAKIMHPEDYKRGMKELTRHYKGLTPVFECEHRLRVGNGEYHWFLGQGRVYKRDDQGRALRIAGVHRDIDAQKRADEALRASEEHFRLAMTAGTAGTWEINLLTSVCLIDDRSRAILGYATNEVPDDLSAWIELVHPDDRFAVVNAFRKHFQGDTPYCRVEARYRTRSGAWMWLDVSGRIVERDESGRAARAFGTFVDIDDRKLAQLRTAESESLYRLLADHSTDIILSITPDGVVKYVSPACRSITGYEPEELRGRFVLDFIEPEEKDHVLQSLSDATEPTVMTSTYRTHRKDGESIFLEGKVRPIFDPSTGCVTEIVGSLRDVTEREKLTADLRAAKEAAEAASRTKSDFLAVMSHELRTPLNGVIGMVDLLSTSPLDERQQRFARAASISAKLLLSAIDDILDFTKIEAGKLEIENIDFSIADVVNDVASLVEERATTHGINFVVEMAPALPRVVGGDPVRIRQMLLNLVSNAFKFTFEGAIRIDVRAVDEGPEVIVVKFSVSDTGVGIPPDAQKRLFTSFTQADLSTTRKYGGTGLGLAITKRLVEIMGGKIGLESQPGRGSTFWFEMPFENCREAFDDASPAPGGGRPLVLAVTRTYDDRAMLRSELANLNAEVDFAMNLVEARNLLCHPARDRMPYTLLVCEDDMLGEDGVHSRETSWDKADFARVVVIVAAHRPPRTRTRDVHGVLHRPLRRSEMRRILAAILTRPTASSPPPPQQIKISGRILVVEDNEISAEVAWEVLRKAGLEVLIAKDGIQAVEMMVKQSFDLVLMDCQLPNQDGFETARQIRHLELEGRLAGRRMGSIPIVALTASALAGDHDRCLAAGMNDYLTKPADGRVLIDTIARNLGSPESATQADAERLASIADPDGPADLVWAASRLNDDGRLLARLATRFLEKLPGFRENLRTALQAEDLKALAACAHNLAGLAGLFAAKSLCAVAASLEIAARSDDRVDAPRIVATLNGALDKFERQLQIFAKKRSTPTE